MFVSFTYPCDNYYTHYGGLKPCQIIHWDRYLPDHPGAPKFYKRCTEWNTLGNKLVLGYRSVSLFFDVSILTNDAGEIPVTNLASLHWDKLHSDVEIFEYKKVGNRLIGVGVMRFDRRKGLPDGHPVLLQLRCDESIDACDSEDSDYLDE